MTDLDLTPADELAHPPGEERLWGESWYFDFATRDGSLGGYVRLGLYPNLGVAWYWACLVGEGRPLVTVIDHDVPLPKAPSLEVRADGLWADHTVETPYEHMTLGCEAFAVAVDDPAEVYGDLRGERVPFGLDLEWETDRGGVYPWIGTTRYEVSSLVHGEVLIGDETIAFDGVGQRDHSWGVRDWWQFGWVWTAGWLEDGTRFHTTRVRIPGLDAFAPGYVMRPDGPVEQIDRCAADEELDGEGFPTSAHLVCGELDLVVEPVAFSPVHLVDDDGSGPRHARFPRALCRFEAADGRRGVGWTEWNQPGAAG
ncbi:MAG: DUF7065 domain-containing protein [Acidimicrobiales bacterium]